MPARLVIADDHELVREGLRSLLERDGHCEIVAEAANGHEAVRLCHVWRPDLVLMDLCMPDLTGLEATRAIRATQPETRVLIITMHDDPASRAQALAVGAAGYLLKHARRAELLDAVHRVLRSDAAAPTALSERRPRHLPGPALTPRERDVLHHLVQGRSNREIGDRLIISRGTVKGYVENIIRKLGAADRTQAAVIATRLALVPPAA